MSNFIRIASTAVNYEMLQKYRLSYREFAEEMELDTLYKMYETNQYHIRDIADVMDSVMIDMK